LNSGIPSPWFDKKGSGNQVKVKTSEGDGIAELIDEKALEHVETKQ